MPDGWRLTVRQGGAVSDPTVDYTSQVLAFEEGDLGTAAFEAAASFGQGTQWSVVLDDDTAEIPRSDLTKSLAGHNQVILSETVSGTEYVLAYGRFASKDWSANSSYPRRQAKITLDDINAEVKGLALREPWVRGAETGRARVLAALAAFCNGSPRLTTVIDNELVAAGDEVAMPAKTYPAATDLAEIFDDCASVEGKVWGVVIHHDGGSHKCFLYKLPTDHTTYASTIVINSDSVGDLDEDDTTAPVVPAIWGQGQATREDPQELANVIVSVYGTGGDQYTLAEDTDNQASYDYWAKPFNDPLAVTAAQAATRAAAMLTISKNEHLTHTPSILLKREQIHLLCAGMSITFRSSAMMGGQYLDTDQTRTVASVRWVPDAGPAGAPARYRADLELDRPLRLLPAGNLPPTVQPPSTSTATGAAGTWGGPPPAQTSVAFVVPSGTDQCLYCFIEYNPPGGGGGGDITSVVWRPEYTGTNEQAMTLVGSVTNAGSTTSAMAVYRLLNPSPSVVSNSNILVTTDGANSETGLGVVLVDHVDQSDPDNTIGTAYGSTSSSSVSVTQPAQGIVINGAGWLDTHSGTPVAPSPVAGQTSLGADVGIGTTGTGDVTIGVGYGDASPGWTFGASKPWCAIAVPVNRTQGTGGVSIGGPGEGSVGTPGTYIPGGTVIEHGDLSGKGGTMHDATQVSITDAGGYYTGTEVEAALQEIGADLATGTGAPTTADYLVGTASGDLSAEIVVGTTPGGELGGTWASPTVDSVHSGSAHLALGTTAGTAAEGDHTHAGGGAHILLADGRSTPFDFTDMLQMDDGSDFLWSDS